MKKYDFSKIEKKWPAAAKAKAGKQKKYNFQAIEKKWQKIWQRNKVYEPDLKNAKKPFYNLMMFPYPSAEGLHVGNMYAFVGSDIYGRLKRMQGSQVFEPIGLDGFGIHSENYALKIGAHPMKQSKVSEKRFYKQLEIIGNGFAWKEKLETYDPAYYKWTQWIFIELFKHGLAYRKKAPVNWCPSCKTVLADEQVVSGKCERCGTVVVKKELEQWFFKITKYADKLLKNLEKIDWSERVKIAQKNWIGKSEGASIKFKIQNSKFKINEIEVFTTRPDTLYGATFMVISPELAKSWIELGWQAGAEVKKYITKAFKNRAEEERGKTGVFSGIYAVNPATKKEIPVWVADYVLAGYGTGAIMAVPAHDQRDFEFARKYKLPIKQVVAPVVRDEKNPPQPGKENTKRNIIHVLLKHPKEDKIVALRSKKFPWLTPITGGIENGEDEFIAAEREIREETGYLNFQFVKKLPFKVFAEFYAAHKDVNRLTLCSTFVFELNNLEKEEISAEEKELHDLEWLPLAEVHKLTPVSELDFIVEFLKRGEYAYEGKGLLINSGNFDGMDSEKAKQEITESVGGKPEMHYRLRDWLISRQRYWGVPIPMIFCPACAKASAGRENAGWQPVAEKDLPVKLPFVKDFRPKGKGVSPLASVKSFYETKCPKCGAKARRETDVSDTFLDSAWYYLRYPSVRSPRSGTIPWDSAITKRWFPVNMYIGGVEHSVLHLLYVRFLSLALHDLKLLEFGKSLAPKGEPFPKFRAHGLLISEGAKMSKSKGNVVNPDEYIKKFGADTLRMYLMFIAPFEQGGDFRDAGILGVSRFLERVWKFSPTKNSNPKNERILHQTIKKVTEDIESLRYNTAISALMILLNAFEEKGADKKQYEFFLKLLAPFAPHITEELWKKFDNKNSINLEKWPVYDKKLIQEDTFEMVIQINGKYRATVRVVKGISQKEAEQIARQAPRIGDLLLQSKPKKVVFVPDRLINFVI